MVVGHCTPKGSSLLYNGLTRTPPRGARRAAPPESHRRVRAVQRGQSSRSPAHRLWTGLGRRSHRAPRRTEGMVAQLGGSRVVSGFASPPTSKRHGWRRNASPAKTASSTCGSSRRWRPRGRHGGATTKEKQPAISRSMSMAAVGGHGTLQVLLSIRWPDGDAVRVHRAGARLRRHRRRLDRLQAGQRDRRLLRQRQDQAESIKSLSMDSTTTAPRRRLDHDATGRADSNAVMELWRATRTSTSPAARRFHRVLV